MKAPIPRIGVAGISRASEPHLIPATKWHDSLNIRFRRGKAELMQRRVEYARLPRAFRFPVTGLFALPVGTGRRMKVIGFAGSRVLGLRSDQTLEVLSGDDNSFNVGDGTIRWAASPHESRFFFTNPLNQVAWTEGTVVKKVVDKFNPAGRYITVFNDHVVVAHYTQMGGYFPYRFAWSDLYKLQFEPKRTNEADYYDCLERVRPASDVIGITGMARQGEILYVYTSDYVFRANYVGLPRIFQTVPFVPGVGCDLPYGLVSNEEEHIFPNLRRQQVYSLRGGKVEQIGDDIIGYLIDDINPSYRDRTWSFYKENDDEAWWVYISKDSPGLFDKAVIFNTADRVWYPATVEDLHSYCVGGRIGSTVDQLSGTVQNLTGTCETLGGEVEVAELWGSSNGRLLRSEVATDGVASLIQAELPFLETGDYIYDAQGDIKETESIIIDAKSTNEIELAVASRRNLSDSPVLVTQPKTLPVGHVDGRLGFPRSFGRSFRYRFQPKALDNLAWQPRGMLYTEIETEHYPTFEEFFKAGSGRFFPPYIGVYTVEMVGAGGGGGAQILLSPNNATCSIIPNLMYPIVETTIEENLLTDFLGTQTSADLEMIVNGTPVKVGVLLDENEDPNFSSGVTLEIRNAVYTALIEAAENVVRLLNGVLVGYTCFTWQKVNAPSFVNVVDWFNNRPRVVSFPAQVYVPKVFFIYYLSSVRALRRAGGASGGKVWAHAQVAALTNFIDWMVGAGQPHVVHPLGHVLGIRGGDSKAAVVGTAQVAIASGGGGGGFDGSTFFDGTSNANSIVGIADFTETVGENATPELPTSGAPITQVVKGGRGFPLGSDTTRTYFRTSDNPGFQFGGGGVGRAEDYQTDLLSSSGADGYVRIRYRLDTQSNQAVSMGGLWDNLNKRTAKRSTTSTFKVGGESTLLYRFRARVRAIVEPQDYAGGTNVVTFIKRGGTVGFSGVNLTLETGRETYRLNQAVVSDPTLCIEITAVFEFETYGQSTITLLQDNLDSLQFEPRKQIPGEMMVTSEATDVHEPQFCIVEIEPLNQKAHDVRQFDFVGFYENIFAGKAEK